MTLGIALAFAILLGALVVFALDRFPIDFVALAILALVLGLGPILGVTPEEAISGFSNPATITVLAMFILSGAIERTGIVNLLAQYVIPLAGSSLLRQLIVMMLIMGPLSAFINNTAAVAILIPVAITLARQHGLCQHFGKFSDPDRHLNQRFGQRPRRPRRVWRVSYV